MTHPGHAFARLPHIRMGDLAGEQVVMFDRASSYHDLTRVAFRSAGVRPRGLRAIRVTDMTPVRRTIVAVRRRDAGPATPILGTFLELLVALAPRARVRPKRRARTRR